jgi:hypothetical protein
MGTVRRSGIRLKSVPFFTEKPYERPVLANPESLVKEEKKRYVQCGFHGSEGRWHCSLSRAQMASLGRE